MIPYTVEVVQDVSDPLTPTTRYIVRAPNHGVGYGHENLEVAYLGCMARAFGVDQYTVDEIIDRKEFWRR
jgi:hypothetical protein